MSLGSTTELLFRNSLKLSLESSFKSVESAGEYNVHTVFNSDKALLRLGIAYVNAPTTPIYIQYYRVIKSTHLIVDFYSDHALVFNRVDEISPLRLVDATDADLVNRDEHANEYLGCETVYLNKNVPLECEIKKRDFLFRLKYNPEKSVLKYSLVLKSKIRFKLIVDRQYEVKKSALLEFVLYADRIDLFERRNVAEDSLGLSLFPKDGRFHQKIESKKSVSDSRISEDHDDVDVTLDTQTSSFKQYIQLTYGGLSYPLFAYLMRVAMALLLGFGVSDPMFVFSVLASYATIVTLKVIYAHNRGGRDQPKMGRFIKFCLFPFLEIGLIFALVIPLSLCYMYLVYYFFVLFQAALFSKMLEKFINNQKDLRYFYRLFSLLLIWGVFCAMKLQLPAIVLFVLIVPILNGVFHFAFKLWYSKRNAH